MSCVNRELEVIGLVEGLTVRQVAVASGDSLLVSFYGGGVLHARAEPDGLLNIVGIGLDADDPDMIRQQAEYWANRLKNLELIEQLESLGFVELHDSA